MAARLFGSLGATATTPARLRAAGAAGLSTTAPALQAATAAAAAAADLHRRPITPFHLAFPVKDLELSRDFYGRVLGCPQGR
ncbi:hypothetical protein HK405_002115, partial [Cladochytrium tenue]